MQLTRRGFLASTAAGLATSLRSASAAAQANRLLLRGGCVLSLDPKVGDFDRADVLIENGKIAAVRPNITADAQVIDAANTIVMPGFVDTHRHMWQGAVRNSLPDGLLNDYVRDILGAVRSAMRPDDVRIGDLVSALGAINAGVTTVLDWSHIGNSPAHTDGAIQGLRESGIRAVYAFGGGTGGGSNRYPDDIRRLRKQYFSSKDQLLTLAMASGMTAGEWAVAREVGASISVHAGGTLAGLEKVLGPDVTYIHCNTFTEQAWKMVADSGGHVSISCPIEMEMGHGIPPIQQALDHNLAPSLSVDVETQMPGDFFTQMRAAFTLQRMLALARQRANEKNRLRDDQRGGGQSTGQHHRHADAGQGRRRHPAADRHDQRRADEQRLRGRRSGDGHQQRGYGDHRRPGPQATRAAGRRRSQSHSPAGGGITRLHRAEDRLGRLPPAAFLTGPSRRRASLGEVTSARSSARRR
jgi:cytosine/adenosine deaminase-related metal-dependent hydrolase